MDNQDHYSITDTTFEEINSVIDFDKIASIIPDFDIIKLLEDNDVGVDIPTPPCAVVVQPAMQPATPGTTFTQVKEQPFSPDMFLMHPVSPGTSMESTLLPYSSQIFPPDPMYFQTGNPNQHNVVSWLSHHSSTEPVLLPSVEPVLSPSMVQITEEAAPVQIKQQQVTQNNQELTPKVPNISGTSLAYVHFFGDAADAPKKRGRKRKYPEEAARKIKMYEMAPLNDEIAAEKRRKNAITSKQHRNKQKNERDHMIKQLKLLIAENHSLKKKLEEETTAKLQCM